MIDAKIKGKFIFLCGKLMKIFPTKCKEAEEKLKKTLGLNSWELEKEEFYDCIIFEDFMQAFATASVDPRKAIINIGKNIYPLIDASTDLLYKKKTALDLILFEAEGFLICHSGKDIKPRQFLKKEKGHVIVKAPAPGYNDILYIGVFEGILRMKLAKNIDVQLVDKLNSIYEIRWEGGL